MPARRRRGKRKPLDQSTRTDQQRLNPHINAISGESRRFCNESFNALSSRLLHRDVKRTRVTEVLVAHDALEHEANRRDASRVCSPVTPISAIFQSKFGLEPFYDAARSDPQWRGLNLAKPERRGRGTMKRMLGAAVLLSMASVMPAQQAAAQDPIGGAIVGGALGGIIGGAVGRGAGGAVAGAVIGATTGAVIASEAQRRRTGYYWWRGGCYYRYPNGAWMQVQPGYC
jgi:hypothetical protein